jgi:hypothetical protein
LKRFGIAPKAAVLLFGTAARLNVFKLPGTPLFKNDVDAALFKAKPVVAGRY